MRRPPFSRATILGDAWLGGIRVLREYPDHRMARARLSCWPSHRRPPSQPATGQAFNTEQLDALVASIALYPDDLLTQLLMASTFPLEIVAAARGGDRHKSLTGDALVKALAAEPGPEREVAGAIPSAGDDEQQSDLVAAARLRVRDTAGERVRRRAAALRRLAQTNNKLQSSPQRVVSTRQ